MYQRLFQGVHSLLNPSNHIYQQSYKFLSAALHELLVFQLHIFCISVNPHMPFGVGPMLPKSYFVLSRIHHHVPAHWWDYQDCFKSSNLSLEGVSTDSRPFRFFSAAHGSFFQEDILKLPVDESTLVANSPGDIFEHCLAITSKSSRHSFQSG
ncbi:3-phenylpropionate/cinnamic acid dioxygenaseferredoxin--NAD(+) reductase component [Striga asiatica]|uniref:3-phenylpropionate/cinnamic acid dioxygenaseferredoxin--NAD(+) reductase component n=1 Tax=Striga asiatica TaxID=4170 RepID=A0A5A7QNL7_STRAF|nr:3-phenylpropionate/cinnamic acid dioxygenaseferredoxin--NAD(+) reductase component [Striga asiatica]